MKKPTIREGTDASLYDSDFYEWTKKVASDIRASSLSRADAERVAEEIEDMGKRDLREVRSRATVLVMHLMKWAVQPEKRSGSWTATILEQRNQLNDLLSDSPSLHVFLHGELATIYDRATHLASAETGIHWLQFMRSSRKRIHVDSLLVDWLPERIDDLFEPPEQGTDIRERL